MFRMFLPVVLLVFAHAYQSPPAFAAPHTELPTLSQCKDLVESALPTIVRFSYDGLHFGCKRKRTHILGPTAKLSPPMQPASELNVRSLADQARISLG